ncbi:MAG: hypothetical protein IPJ65_40060 [Archangiaceae bacterium]|nr:hypothetical protein [Archangiaceae bacterium]
MTTTTTKWVVVALACAALVACLPGANAQVNTADAQGVIAGFWRGLWHGALVPLTFIVSLFTSSVQVYESHNTGGWYNAGYVLGVMIAFGGGGGGGAAAGRRWRRR